MSASSNCAACERGKFQFAEASTVCIACASGKFTNAPAASDASFCISSLDSESVSLALDALQISMTFSLTEDAFLKLQSEYILIAARASRLNAGLFQILAVQEQTQRVLESPATRAVMGVNISKSNCTAIQILTGPDHLSMMQAAGLQRPSKISSNADCNRPTLANVTFARDRSLSQELRDQAVAINSVVVTVLAGSVASNVALQIVSSMSLTTTVSSKGASIYHLIGAVQFLNIFGKMFNKNEPARFEQKLYHSSTQRRDIGGFEGLRNLSALGDELNGTFSAAAEFR
jgi:hypothetical protein